MLKNLMNRKMTYAGFGIDEVSVGDGTTKMEGFFTVINGQGGVQRIALSDLDGTIALQKLWEGLELACDMYNFCKNSPELFRQMKQ